MVNLVQDHYLFQPCSAGSRWSVQGTEVVEALKQYPADSSHAVFLEARGEFSQPGALTGTAGDLVVQELLYVAPTSEHAACATATSQYKVWAGGNEPSWSAQIRGDTMILTQPEIAQREFKLADSADAEGAVVYRATAPDAQVELTVTQQPCRNAAGEYFGFSARATFGEQHLEGCARPGE
jgi:uncharacterized membrane protein